MEPVRVRALSNVLGLYRGDEVEVQPTPRVEALIRGGHLQWLDDPACEAVAPDVTEPIDDEMTEEADPPKPAKRARKSVADDE